MLDPVRGNAIDVAAEDMTISPTPCPRHVRALSAQDGGA
jgi:hypothetical protein